MPESVDSPSIRIANASDAPLAAPGTPSVIVGWGTTSEDGDPSDVLREASIPILPDQTCSNDYGGNFVKRTMLCAGYLPGGIDTCQGDSGGPLFVDDGFGLPLEVGIVSFGDGCARPDTPGVYTRVSGVGPDIIATLESDPVAPVGKPTTTPGTVTTQVRGQAQVRVTVDANGLATTVVAEYGGSRDLGSFASAYAPGTGDQQFELSLRKLVPGQEVLLPDHRRERCGLLHESAPLVHRERQRLEAAHRQGERELGEGWCDGPSLLHDLRRGERADEGEDHGLPDERGLDRGHHDELQPLGEGRALLGELACERRRRPLPLLRRRLRPGRKPEPAGLRAPAHPLTPTR